MSEMFDEEEMLGDYSVKTNTCIDTQNSKLSDAIKKARKLMYHRTDRYFTFEEQEKIRTWIDATLHEVELNANISNNNKD